MIRPQKIASFAVFLALGGCASPSPRALAANDYTRILADHFGPAGARGVEASKPWAAVTGEIMVCIAKHASDGHGGFYPAAEYWLYAFQDGKIVATEPYPECRNNTTYAPIRPATRS